MKDKITGYLAEKRGFYYVVLKYPQETGQRSRKWYSTGLTVKNNKTTANKLLRQMLHDANCGEEIHGVNERKPAAPMQENHDGPSADMRFSDYLLFWLEWKRTTWEAVTYQSYSRAIRNQIAPYFANRHFRLNTITALDIQRFYTYVITVRGNKGNTAIHYHANIRKALADAVKLKLIPYNPAVDVERPKADNFVSVFYNAEELSQLLALFQGTKMELPVTLSAYYGLRRSEVLGLKWSAVDFENRTLTISHTLEIVNVDGSLEVIMKDRTKTKSSFRTLPLIPVVEDILLKAREQQRENRKLCGRSYCKDYLDYVCVDTQGMIVTPDYVSSHFHAVLEKSGMKMIRFHDLRHSCASLLLANGVSIKEIQVWLGHSNYSTTANIYAHLDVSSKQNAANAIASCLSGQGTKPEAKHKKTPKRKSA